MEKLAKNKDRNIHLQITPGTFIYVENYNNSTNFGNKFSLEKFKNGQLYYKFRAEKLEWDSITNKWHFEDYYIRTIDGMDEKIYKGKELDTTLKLQPSDLYYYKEDFEVMNFWELNKFIEDEKLKGSDKVKIYEVEKNKRIASPFATIILTLIGVSLSSRKVRGGIGMHLGLGITITFAFILFMQISTVFATFGNLSPALAVWIPNIIFGLLGIFLLKTAPK